MLLLLSAQHVLVKFVICLRIGIRVRIKVPVRVDIGVLLDRG